MQKVFLFRTGTVKSKENIFLGWLNIPLNEKGIKEAKEISKKIKKEKIKFAFCSDQLRGKQALVEVLKNHKKAEVIIDHRLRERNYGIFTGHEKDIFKNYLPNKFKEIHHTYNGKVEKGENFNQVSKRVFNFMNDLLAFMKTNKGNVVICAHTSSLKLIRAYLENLDELETELLYQSAISVKEYNITFKK
jgi:alpha-ribazole phosphatase